MPQLRSRPLSALKKTGMKKPTPQSYMSYNLNSLKGGYIGDCVGYYYRGY